MTYVLDIAVILIFALAVLTGYRRGFVKTVAGIVTFLAAVLVAATFAAPLSEWVYDTAVEPSIVSAVEEQLASAQDGAAQQVDAAYEALPQVVKNLLRDAGVADAATLGQVLPTMEGATMTAQVTAAARTVAMPLAEALASVVLFVLTNILVSWLFRLLNLVAKLPVLKNVNKSIGLLGGVLSGILWVMFAVTVLQVVLSFGVLDGVLDMTTVNDSVLVKWLVSINPFATTVINYMK